MSFHKSCKLKRKPGVFYLLIKMNHILKPFIAIQVSLYLFHSYLVFCSLPSFSRQKEFVVYSLLTLQYFVAKY